MTSSDKIRHRSFMAVVFLALFTLSSCSITTSTHIDDDDGTKVKRTAFSIGTPFGTLGADDDEDDD